jgi:hypothetical protein
MNQRHRIDVILNNRYIVDLTKPWHVAWWADYFGVSEVVLQDAISLVGPRAAAIGLYLEHEEPGTPVDVSATQPHLVSYSGLGRRGNDGASDMSI